MLLHIINHTTKDIIVHRAGCRDIPKDLKRANSDWQIECNGDPVQAVVDDLNDSFGWSADSGDDQPWFPEHVHVLPCVNKC